MTALGLLAGLVPASSRKGTYMLRARLLSLLEQRARVCSMCSAIFRNAQQQQQQQPSDNTTTGRGHSLYYHHRLSSKPPPLLLPPTRLLRKTTTHATRKATYRPHDPDSDLWGYTGMYDLDQWADDFPHSNGLTQSPVNIVTSTSVLDDTLTAFTFVNFNTTSDISWDLMNNGHTVLVVYKHGDLHVSNGGLKSEYKVVQFHFHWGSSNSIGSEHTIDGKRFPMELHIVAFNSEYGTIAKALDHTDGLAVLGMFFEVAENDNHNYTGLITALNHIKEPVSSISMPPLPLDSLMPTNKDKYSRYSGSLTTPPCSEVVIWTLFKDSVPISNKQLDAFRALTSIDQDLSGNRLPMVNNFRPVQPLNGRQIRSNY